MAAYVYASVEVIDLVLYEDYRRQVAATVAAYGGRFLVRGGAVEVLEGSVNPQRQVILEFPDMARLKTWYHSSEYAPLIELRKRATKSTLFAIEGV